MIYSLNGRLISGVLNTKLKICISGCLNRTAEGFEIDLTHGWIRIARSKIFNIRE